MKIKQNKNTVAIFLAMIFCLSLCSLSALAYSDTSSNGIDFSSQPPSVYTDGPFSPICKDSYGYYYFLASSSPSSPFYAFLTSTNTNGSGAVLVLCSPSLSSFPYYRQSSQDPSLDSFTISSRTASCTLDSSSNIYYDLINGIGNGNINNYSSFSLPVFSSLDVGLNALRDWLDNPPAPPVSGQPLTITVKPGYVLFANVESFSDNRYVVSTTSNIAITPSTQLSNNQLFGFSSSLPSGSFSMPLPGSTSFPWTAITTNLYGKATNWIATRSFAPDAKYLFIANPLVSNYRLAGVNGNTEVVDDATVNNGNLQVTISLVDPSDVHLIPLNAAYVYDPSNGVEGVNQGGDGDNPYVVNVDPDGNVSITDQDGNVVDPPAGGNTDVSSPNMFQTINAWLENIAQQIGGFFTGAVGAVSTLISAGSAFIQQLVGLYSWLPPAVLSVLSSALILVITIGVIKVFL